MRTRERRHGNEIQLKDGFYIDVYTKGMKKGVKIRSENKKDMEESALQYKKYKEVVILGEYRNGVSLVEIPAF